MFDISTPATPRLVAYYDTPGGGTGLHVVGDLIFVADYNAGLSILRLLDTDQPTVAITTPTTNTAFPTTSAQITLGGTATDLQGVVRVTWENDRGGGGVSQGTNAWSVSNIQLAAGVNVLTVTAEDAQGNLARDTLTVTATFPELEGPSILVSAPVVAPEFVVTGETLPLAGTAADASGVQSVVWANDRGGSGAASGTTQWTADIPLQPGPNGITVTATDTHGNVSRTDLLVTYVPPETVPPTVMIGFPTEAQQWSMSEEVAYLSGSASDEGGLARVHWTSDRGSLGEAQGTEAWRIDGILLQTGLNVITVTAEDLNGNMATDTLAIQYSPGDGDEDGLLDVWEELYFATLVFGANDDPDGDGQNNDAEQRAGTIPADGASRFEVVHTEFVAQGISLAWPSRPGNRYRVECSETMVGSWDVLRIVDAEEAPATESSFTDTDLTSETGQKFYRVTLVENDDQ